MRDQGDITDKTGFLLSPWDAAHAGGPRVSDFAVMVERNVYGWRDTEFCGSI